MTVGTCIERAGLSVETLLEVGNLPLLLTHQSVFFLECLKHLVEQGSVLEVLLGSRFELVDVRVSLSQDLLQLAHFQIFADFPLLLLV